MTRRTRTPLDPSTLVVRKGSVLGALPPPRLPGSPVDLGRMTAWIVAEVGSATTRRVYHVRGSDGAEYAFKESSDHEILDKEERRTAKLAGRVPIARVMQTGPGWLLREWIEGPTSAEWLERRTTEPHVDIQRREDDAQRERQLRGLLRALAAMNLYVARLTPENIILSEKGSHGGPWIIDCGKVREVPEAEALERYRSKLTARWGIKL